MTWKKLASQPSFARHTSREAKDGHDGTAGVEDLHVRRDVVDEGQRDDKTGHGNLRRNRHLLLGVRVD